MNYYQIKFIGRVFDKENCSIINEFTYEELISHLAASTVEYIWIGEYWYTKPIQAYDKFLKKQTLSANNASDIRYYQIVESTSVDDVWAGKYRVIDVRNFEDAVRSCTDPSYKLNILELDRFRRINKHRNNEPRQHQKIYTYGSSPSMAQNFRKARFMVEEFDDDEEIPNYVKIKPATRPKRNGICDVWNKTIVNENNWKSKKCRKQYLVNKSNHRYICKGDPFFMEDEFDQDELLQEYYDTYYGNEFYDYSNIND